MRRTSSDTIQEDREFLEDVCFEDEFGPKSGPDSKFCPGTQRLFPRVSMLILHTSLISISVFAIILALSERTSALNRCSNTEKFWTPYTAATGRDFETIIRNNSMVPQTRWQGPPSQTVDAAWKDIWLIPDGTFTKEQMQGIGKDPERLVRWPDALGGGYLGRMEVFHQLHCLDKIRQGTLRDYYGKDAPPQGHVDHCINYLRQTLMCYSDTTVKPYIWIEGIPGPLPDVTFSTQCRDFEDVREFGLSVARPKSGQKELKKEDAGWVYPYNPYTDIA